MRPDPAGSPPPNTRALRDMFGQFASGVTVIASGDDDDIHAMTANAFMSVSLEPALILVSLQNESRMRARIERVGPFGVSILAEGQSAASDHCAGRLDAEDAVRFERLAGAPVLKGALAWMACSIESACPAGDHTLIIARVNNYGQAIGKPLLFYGGKYRSLDQEV